MKYVVILGIFLCLLSATLGWSVVVDALSGPDGTVSTTLKFLGGFAIGWFGTDLLIIPVIKKGVE